FFTETETVFTQMDKARRVWNGIQYKNNAAIKTIYFAFLSEIKGVELLLYKYICSLYGKPLMGSPSDSEGDLVKIHQYAGMVAREKHRIETGAAFNISKDDVYFSTISPIFDVLPLISKYYRSKFPNKEFIVYDLKRKYAIHYNLDHVEMVSMGLTPEQYTGPLTNTSIKSLINHKLFLTGQRNSNTSYLGEKTAV
ncbi:MAG TPA: DUF4130 domain-containing protein, partial [Arenibacter sp.]|nr:DUF4130 domain-containing protein [Arenibacter sp.]